MQLSQIGVLITGAGRGLGRALGLELASAGARIALVARNPDELRAVEREIRAQGGEAHAIIGDVGRKEEVYPIVGQAARLVGPISLLINNASSLGALPLRSLADTDCETLGQVLETNLVGPFRLTKALVGNMWLRNRGCVINISSDAAVEPYPHWGAYGVSKAGLDHLTRIFAAELPEVAFFSVDPGEMDTRMHAEAMPDADPSLLSLPEAVARRLRELIEASEEIPSGSRIVLSNWKGARHDAASGHLATGG